MSCGGTPAFRCSTNGDFNMPAKNSGFRELPGREHPEFNEEEVSLKR
jgi:hypothetical protein